MDGARLRDAGLLTGGDAAAHAKSALARLRASGWGERTIETAASTTSLDLWRAVAATYASAYLRAPAGAMPCDFRFGAVDTRAEPVAADAATQAAWWSDASGIPPGAGVHLLGGVMASADPTAMALDCLRELWTGHDTKARALHTAVTATAAKLPRDDLPVIVAHGEADGLLPIEFASTPYVTALQSAGREPVYWRVPHAQHFDAFLGVPGFGERYVPLMPYGYAALDRLWAHLQQGAALPASRRFQTRSRGSVRLGPHALGL